MRCVKPRCWGERKPGLSWLEMTTGAIRHRITRWLCTGCGHVTHEVRGA